MAPPSLDYHSESLLCREEDVYGESEQERGCNLHASCKNSPSKLSMAALEMQDSSDLQDAVSALIERERFHLPCPEYEEKYESEALDVGFRQKAVSWLLKVRAFYNFGPLTAVLSVNYLDRFLSLHQLPMGKTWMVQLLSVACISLAAKMEETEVPLLLDLQVAPDCLFEPRTVQRMELLVLSTLEWRVSSVTPFSYIEYFMCKCSLTGNVRSIIFSRISELILWAVQDLRFLSYQPSSIATAAVLCSIQEMFPLQISEFKRILFLLLPLHLQDPSESCFMLMIDMFHAPSLASSLKLEACRWSVPQSPMGVLDATFSCDSESTLKSVGSVPSVHISPSPKKRKVDDFCTSVEVCAL